MEKKHNQKPNTGIFIPGGALLGVGIGLAVGNPGAGLLIGLGAGFLAMGLIMVYMK